MNANVCRGESTLIRQKKSHDNRGTGNSKHCGRKPLLAVKISGTGIGINLKIIIVLDVLPSWYLPDKLMHFQS
jgi:hypothetical protein